MGKNLLILGAGQYGQLVSEIAAATEQFDKIAFLDDFNVSAIGPLANQDGLRGEYAHAIVAIGDSATRMFWLRRLEENGYSLAPLIHPQASVSPSAQLGEGSIVEPMAVIQSNAVIGKGCLISSGTVIKHNAIVGDGCYLDCNCVVMQNTTVKNGVKVFANTTVEE